MGEGLKVEPAKISIFDSLIPDDDHHNVDAFFILLNDE